MKPHASNTEVSVNAVDAKKKNSGQGDVMSHQQGETVRVVMMRVPSVINVV